MRLDLNDGRFDPRGFIERRQFFQIEVGYSYRSAFAVIDETFHRSPGVEEGHTFVVDDFVVFIPGVEVVSRLERERSVGKIEVHKINSESLPARLKRGLDPLRPMVGIP